LTIRVYNVMEDIVNRVISEYHLQRPGFYHCEQCLADIKAITLNRLKPRYVVSEKGELFSKVGTLTGQYMSDIYKELSVAIQLVERDPHCDQSKTE
jgi:competence protein ComFB